MMGAYKETVYSRHNRAVTHMDFQQLKTAYARPAQTQVTKSQHGEEVGSKFPS